MSVLIRGAKNAIRNPIRTVSIVVLLAVATALALSLLLANQAVKNKLTELKSTGATTITVNPAGSQGFQGGGEPLTSSDYDKVKSLTHIVETSAQLNLMTRRMFRADGPPGASAGGTIAVREETIETENKIDLESSIVPGTLGNRNFGSLQTDEMPAITIPVSAMGLSGKLDAQGKQYNLTKGSFLTRDDGYESLISTTLAAKNNLDVGGTFTAYDKTFTVVGIYDAGNDFLNNTVIMPLKTAQTLAEQPDEISTIAVKADSIENIASVKTAIESTLGNDKVDLTSAEQNTQDAISGLQSVQKISIIGVLIALAAAAVIVFLVMVMIVRERRREIAVLKAIGASNAHIVGQFVTEAVLLTALSVIVGMGIATLSGGGLTNALVSQNTASSQEQTQNGPTTVGGGPQLRVGGPGFTQSIFGDNPEGTESVKNLVSDIKTTVGLRFLLTGIGAVIIIAILGSAIPALAISKVRPAEVMRGEN